MSMVTNYAAHSNRQKRTRYRPHRRAMQHNTTPAQRARYVAESIALRLDEGRPWTWADYGLADKPEQQALVQTALAALR